MNVDFDLPEPFWSRLKTEDRDTQLTMAAGAAHLYLRGWTFRAIAQKLRIDSGRVAEIIKKSFGKDFPKTARLERYRDD